MPGDGRLRPPAPPGRGGIPAGRCGAPAPGPTGRGTPGTAPGASGARGAVEAWEVKGLLPIRGGPEVARGTAGPGRGPAAGRPGSPGRLVVGSETAGAAACAAGATGARKTSVDGVAGSAAGATVTGGATGAATTGGASAARGLSAVRAVAAAFGAAGGAATTAGAGKDSLSLRTTGASIVEEAERTNSPNS